MELDANKIRQIAVKNLSRVVDEDRGVKEVLSRDYTEYFRDDADGIDFMREFGSGNDSSTMLATPKYQRAFRFFVDEY